jgi:hypothetical protein
VTTDDGKLLDCETIGVKTIVALDEKGDEIGRWVLAANEFRIFLGGECKAFTQHNEGAVQLTVRHMPPVSAHTASLLAAEESIKH